MTRSRTFIINHELGGQDIDWHVRLNPGSPATFEYPGDDEEFIVEEARMLVEVRGREQVRIDVLDLLEDVAGELSDSLLEDLRDKIDTDDVEERDE